MKILIYGINFYPELTGVGKYTGEMAGWLAEKGHEVRVITAPPYYPEWKVGFGYSSWRYRFENLKDIRVYRCPLFVPLVPTGLKRLLHLATFSISSLPILIYLYFWKPDVIWTVEPTFFSAILASAFAKIRRCSSWLHVQDFEIDAAFALGILKGMWISRLILFAELRVMSCFDRVSTISRQMVEKMINKGLKLSKISIFLNWVDVNEIYPCSGSNSYRKALGITKDQIVVLYSGNMGRKQGLEILADVARICSGYSSCLRFIFCGNGSGKNDLVVACADLCNVTFLDLQQTGKLCELLNMADIHLLPQLAGAADLVMPSKMTGMLASGRPIVATAHTGTEIAGIVQDCGIVVEPGDGCAVAQAIQLLSKDSDLRSKYGQIARKFAVRYLSREVILDSFEREMCMLGEKQKTMDK